MVSIAIACQGGSSHTAFTAGVLKRILQEDGKKYDIIALSGTSGGAICALLAWYGLLTDGRNYAVNLIESFWKELSARTPGDMVFNEWFVKTSKFQDSVLIPQASPYDFPPFGQEYLRSLIEKQVDFKEIKRNKKFKNPKIELIIGAVDVFSGNFSVFKNSNVSSDVIMASAAIPDFFWAVPVETCLFNWNEIPGEDNKKLIDFIDQNYGIAISENIEKIDDNKITAYAENKDLSLTFYREKNKVVLEIDGKRTDEFIAKPEDGKLLNIFKKSQYWDGVYSQNPPLRDFVDGVVTKPEEIWVIQINPKKTQKLPRSSGAIRDRRNELSGNLSLYQELYFIDKVNEWIEDGTIKEGKYRQINVRFIKMLRELGLETKLDRNPKFIEDMMNYGGEQANEFLKNLLSKPIKKGKFGNVLFK